MPFLKKNVSKVIMTRSKLGNKILTNRAEENMSLYFKQRNYCVSFLRKAKKVYHSNLDEKNVTDNRSFWKTIKPLLFDKLTNKKKTNLSENREMLKRDTETTKVSNIFYSNVV